MNIVSRIVRNGLSSLAAALCAVVLVASPAVAGAGPPPASMASLGDSITRGFNACGWYVDCTWRSFSTGGSTLVNSHYLRILAKNPAIYGHNYNDGKSGAKASAMPAQAAAAVSQKVQYATMLIGANDACTSSESTMTPVSTYRAYIDGALSTLKSGLPNARIAVISIPDIYRLWEVGHTNAAALTAWSVYGICPSMLARAWSTSSADEARRQRVRQRVIDFNSQLAPGLRRLRPEMRLRRQRGVQLPVHPVPGVQLGLLPPQHQRAGETRGDLVHRRIQLVISEPHISGCARLMSALPPSPRPKASGLASGARTTCVTRRCHYG